MDYTNMPEEFKDLKGEIQKTEQDFVQIKTIFPISELKFTQSKFGGNPFLLNSTEYPKTPDGRNLNLLAQINFEEVPRLDNFPKGGLLQFFIDGSDPNYLLGMNINNLTLQNGFRVIYFPKEKVDEFSAIKNFEWPVLPEGFVLKQELELSFALKRAPMSPQDFRMYKNGKLAEAVYDFDSDNSKWYWENCEASGHKIGGYPYFTQDDPRHHDYTTLLLQMDSETSNKGKDYEIIWGDAGVGNFFIRPDDLANLKFDNVAYTWDCT